MWSQLKRKTKKLFNVFKRRRRDTDEEYMGIDGESIERLEHLLSQKSPSDIEMQANGQWLSKSLIDAIVAKTYEQKLLCLCHQKEVYRLESIFTNE